MQSESQNRFHKLGLNRRTLIRTAIATAAAVTGAVALSNALSLNDAAPPTPTPTDKELNDRLLGAEEFVNQELAHLYNDDTNLGDLSEAEAYSDFLVEPIHAIFPSTDPKDLTIRYRTQLEVESHPYTDDTFETDNLLKMTAAQILTYGNSIGTVVKPGATIAVVDHFVSDDTVDTNMIVTYPQGFDQEVIVIPYETLVFAAVQNSLTPGVPYSPRKFAENVRERIDLIGYVPYKDPKPTENMTKAFDRIQAAFLKRDPTAEMLLRFDKNDYFRTGFGHSLVVTTMERTNEPYALSIEGPIMSLIDYALFIAEEQGNHILTPDIIDLATYDDPWHEIADEAQFSDVPGYRLGLKYTETHQNTTYDQPFQRENNAAVFVYFGPHSKNPKAKTATPDT